MDLRQLRAQAHAGHIDAFVKTGNVLGQRALQQAVVLPKWLEATRNMPYTISINLITNYHFNEIRQLYTVIRASAYPLSAPR